MVLYLGIAILIVLLGCAPNWILMDQQTKESLSAIREIKVLYYESPALLVPPTIVPMPFGVKDPILQVKKGFLASMQTSLPKTTLSEVPHPLLEDDLEQLKREWGQGYLLDFKTTKWGILSNPVHGYSFAVYHSRARLVNLSEAKIIWQGLCYLVESDPIRRPSTTDLTSDNWTLFKEYLAKLTTSCVAELNRQFTDTSTSK